MNQFYDEEKIIKSDIDENFVIIGRRINGFFENAAVTCDNSANRLHFKMADTFDGVSLWDKEIKIIYLTPDGYTDFAYPHSLERKNGIMTFSWLLNENVSRVAGSVTFAIRISQEDFVWNSLPASFKVSQGIMESGAEIPEYAAEWIETLDEKLAGMPDAIEKNKLQITDVNNKISNHVEAKNNPHFVTKQQVGLGNADNTSDADKPISTAMQEALSGKADKEEFENHAYNGRVHITVEEREKWNNKYSKVETDEMLSEKENTSNKSEKIEDNADDMAYPTVKAVIDYVKKTKPVIDENLSAESQNAVQNKMVSLSVANALKSVAKGNALQLEDVSPIQHMLKVKTNPGGTRVSCRGKNMLPLERKLKFPADEQHEIKCSIAGPFVMSLCINVETAATTPSAAFVKFVYDDGTETLISGRSWKLENKGEFKKTVVGDSEKILKNVTFLNWCAMGGEVYDVQIESGMQATEYVPYAEPSTHVSDADGNVSGIKSIYPVTVLSCENADAEIEVEYNKDINKAFAELENAILSLGGNV